MSKEIDPAVQERIRALCKQVTVAYDLDAEIQEELYGHMEDKLLAYLAGEEKMSGEDAFILVREHFGNPAALKEILQAVHEPGEDVPCVRVSLPRRLAAALVATMAVSLITNYFVGQIAGFFADPRFSVQFALWVVVATQAAAVALLWKLLLTWQRQLMQGKKPWFVRWPTHWMWVTAGAALLVPLFWSEGILFHSQSSLNPGPFGVAIGIALVLTLYIALQCAWLWWSDRAPRTRRGLEWTLLSLVGLNLYFALFGALTATIQVSVGEVARTGIHKPLTLATLLDWQEAKLWWSANNHEAPLQLLSALATQLTATVAITLLAYGVYILARRIQRRMANRHTRGQVIA